MSTPAPVDGPAIPVEPPPSDGRRVPRSSVQDFIEAQRALVEDLLAFPDTHADIAADERLIARFEPEPSSTRVLSCTTAGADCSGRSYKSDLDYMDEDHVDHDEDDFRLSGGENAENGLTKNGRRSSGPSADDHVLRYLILDGKRYDVVPASRTESARQTGPDTDFPQGDEGGMTPEVLWQAHRDGCPSWKTPTFGNCESLLLSRRGFAKISHHILRFENLLTLFLQANGIRRVEQVRGLKRLRELYLQDNVVDDLRDWGGIQDKLVVIRRREDEEAGYRKTTSERLKREGNSAAVQALKLPDETLPPTKREFAPRGDGDHDVRENANDDSDRRPASPLPSLMAANALVGAPTCAFPARLLILHLAGNRIKAVPRGTLRQCPHLNCLNLARNHIEFCAGDVNLILRDETAPPASTAPSTGPPSTRPCSLVVSDHVDKSPPGARGVSLRRNLPAPLGHSAALDGVLEVAQRFSQLRSLDLSDNCVELESDADALVQFFVLAEGFLRRGC